MGDDRIPPISHDEDQASVRVDFNQQAYRLAIQQAVRALVAHQAAWPALAHPAGVTLHDEIAGHAQYQRREITALVPTVAAPRQPRSYLLVGHQRF